LGNTHLSTQSQTLHLNTKTFHSQITIAIGMVCASAQDTTPVTCSEVLTISDCTSLVSPKSSLYTDYECGSVQDINGCIPENCCGPYVFDFCIPNWIADGYCDLNNNHAACDYDRGDCCECTCMDEEYTCGHNGFACKDPSTSCVDDVGELPMGPCDTPCLENCDLDWTN